jgi:hypothetical protein
MKEAPLRKILTALGINADRKNSRGWLPARCPFAPFRHEGGTDRKPSFFVKVEDCGLSAYKCHSCKSHGTIRHLVASLEDYQRIDDPKVIDEAICANMYPLAWEEPASRFYLQDRGITQEAAELMRLVYDPDLYRVLFPVRCEEGHLYGWAGRAIYPEDEPKVKNYPGLKKEHRLLGEELWQEGKPAFVVEGLFAYARLISIGAREICNPVAILGSDMSIFQRDLLANHGEPVYLCLDLDSAGEIGTYGSDRLPGAIQLLKSYVPVMVALYPHDRQDVDLFEFQDVKEIIETNHELV